MHQNLTIKNFLVIKKADIDIKKINVLIGPQANGKSIIAKLVYFFNSISFEINESIRLNKNKRELNTDIFASFEEKFPRYTWEGANFTISYSFKNVTFTLEGKKNNRSKTTLTLKYNDGLDRYIKSCKRAHQKSICEMKDETLGKVAVNREHRLFYERIIEGHASSHYSDVFKESAFIPASRSFFANLQKNIFTFLASNLDIDPYLKEFGSLYEASKRWYNMSFFTKTQPQLYKELSTGLTSVVGGDYTYQEDQDWIVAKNGRVNLANASSGQQEALPMLLVLSTWPLMRALGENGGRSKLFIEEPEAHLFPTSQSSIVSLLSSLYSKTRTDLFITTHSPYILSALNNLILAGDKVSEGKINEEEFKKLNNSGSPVAYEDVSAYTISNGEVKPITDNEFRMIGAEMLDDVSGHFENVMNELLEL
ncbi:AAA family ATPase [Vibrio alginolyticus]|uniref:AAA family ATPase n=1 Tax=unclassified Vibrio TaxID=2614977 RepID=UPI001965D1D6|nr:MULTISPECIES: AAA family ATPase [unclassified Vibrio]EGQ9097489.1 AAA family ATPase [Vibrio alginolyticus]EGR2550891.1 ATP-binding protein [Vibrio alginolyticus]MDW2003804.1 AAA family ATPase [Vibrio sp. 431]QRZ22451.1 AAA family ATPase [Vibrio sp. sp1]HDU8585681.1 AAA family ATPase [Vibrio alginolyticus]